MCLAQGPQCSDAGEARTRGPSVSSQALYHWATALPPIFGCFGQSLKVIMYALLYVYEWTDGQVLSFVKRTGWNVKRALSRLRLKHSMSKCPGRDQNDLLLLQCDSGKSREFIEKTTQKHRFWNNATTFSETIPQQHFLDLELKIIKVPVN